jgi:hypothetical protein
MEETTTHLLTKCNFSEAAWNMIAGKFNLAAYVDLSSTRSASDWVRNIISTGSVEDKRRNLGILSTFWWMV